MVIARYNSNGYREMFIDYNGASNLDDEVLDLIVDANIIVANIKSKTSLLTEFRTLKYEYKDFFSQSTNDNVSGTTIANDILIRFEKSALKMNTINSKKIAYGKLGEFLKDSSINDIDNTLKKLSFAGSSKDFDVRKVIFGFTEEDSLTKSRTGVDIRIPDFYTELLVRLPVTLNTKIVADTLTNLKPIIRFAQQNFVYETFYTPNDPTYPNQSSLQPTTSYPNAHVHVHQAWNFSKGQNYVNVGVYDDGLFTQTNEWNGRVNYQFQNGSGLPIDPFNASVAGHALGVTGILGANTNNSDMVSGIAGGDVTAGQSGVELSDMKILSGGTLINSASIKYAYLQGAVGKFSFTGYGNDLGFGLHVSNHSYGRHGASFLLDYSMIEGINFQNQAGVAFVAARGNFGVNSSGVSNNGPAAPACYKPNAIMNVGATDNSGNRCIGPVGTPPSAFVQGANFTCPQNFSIDFMAPGVSDNVKSTVLDPGIIWPGKSASNQSNSVSWIVSGNFSGTSASAPHVAGTAALMMSHRNLPNYDWDNLVHEDIEEIIKRNCIDLTGFSYGAPSPFRNQTLGADSATGHGKINAAAAVEAVSKPKYNIRHIDHSHYVSSSTISGLTLHTAGAIRYWQGIEGPPAGYYTVNIYKNTYNYTYNFSNEILLGYWPIYGLSTGAQLTYNTTDIIPPLSRNEVTILNASLTGATLETYFYEFLGGSNFKYPSGNYQGFFPTNPKAVFTLYTLASPVSIKELEPNIKYFNVFPNPSNGIYNLGLSSQNATKSTIKINDITGKLIYERNWTLQEGNNETTINIQNFASGIYFTGVSPLI
jgi:hypothetical protein